MNVASPAALAGLLQSRLAESGDPSRVVTLSELLVSILSYPVVRGALDLAGKAEYDLSLLGFLRSGDLVQVDPAVVEAVEREAGTLEPSLEFASDLGDSLLRLRRLAPEGAEVRALEPSDPAPERLDPGPETFDPAPQTIDPGPDPSEPEPPDAPTAGSFAIVDHLEPWPPVPDAGEVEGAGTSAETVPELQAGDVVRVPELDVAPTDEPPVAPADEPEVPPVDETEVPLSHEPETDLNDPRVVTEPEPWVPDPATPTCWRCGEPLPDRPIVFFCTQCGVSQDNRRCTECGDRVEAAWRFCGRCGTGLSGS